MLRKGLLLAALVASLWSMIVPAQAQDAGAAFLYNGITRQLLRVDLASGAQTRIDLGLDENVFISGRDIAFSADGRRAVLCYTRTQPEAAQGETHLVVFDLTTQARTLDLPLGRHLSCRVTAAGLRDDTAQVAVSIVSYFPGSQDMDTSGPIWRLLVVDTISGAISAALNADDPAVQAAGMLPDSALLPDVRFFAGNQIIFAEVPWAVGGAPEWRAFSWLLDSGIVSLDTSGRWGKSGLAYLPRTGEQVWIDLDPNLPALETGGPMTPFNVVRLVDASGIERTLYSSAEWVLADARWINGGQQLAILQVSAFDEDHPDQQDSRWLALGRDGSQTELAAGAIFSQAAAAPGGMALFEMSFNADFSQQYFNLSYVDGRGQRVPLWSDQEPGWELAGATPGPLADNLPPFTADF
jgi:hypothetical protein